uniref:Lipocalin/cytosolic fatty-acid binding domain-containing protein n=1 Tax=Craspedostauros australis TaxID=1486917 RepID=A0A7R9WXH5_9STRA|mmetsp:Transcript_23322/g.65054  ORF Transcript_23322/g.65054 Transcript_23322/m.65054 type:complete len:193 (+) Transcript_23322:222-800(+)|eukprot:CAMPEP_0198112282 /NCGR_PEP_ID=MMETSP1442-20131203/4151_1 /TAXON_ID= /ORGANISM="Craspedostauros australis, Strain CCMP3328" /LENGTH=192 /DNA_ID=CAMNT_0043769003 /DNA_START=173 /DNA_END=751 /DNA_ORIENTATION=-
MGNSASANLPKLQVVPNCETAQVMGRPWFVIGVKPTAFETTCSNAVERYTLLEGKSHDINIDFQYNDKDPITSKLKSLPQKGWIQGDRENSGLWKVSPVWPIKMPYNIIEVDDKDYSYMVVGYPSRAYCWILGREPTMDDDLYNDLTNRLKEKHQYTLDGLRKVPQVWTKDEREKRGLSKEELPDKFLTSKP